jgi:hypothetical protein
MRVKGTNEGNFQRPDPGTYVARCVRIIDLGTQTGEYQGTPTIRRQVVLGWELPTELIPEGEYKGQPFLVTKFYTASLNEKATLRHDLENWRTKPFTEEELGGFDLANILGKPCLVTITLTENGKSKVTGVTSPPRGTKVPEQFNPSLNFSLEPGEFDPSVYESLSDWFKDTIAASPEFALATGGVPTQDYKDVDFGTDDIPF